MPAAPISSLNWSITGARCAAKWVMTVAIEFDVTIAPVTAYTVIPAKAGFRLYQHVTNSDSSLCQSSEPRQPTNGSMRSRQHEVEPHSNVFGQSGLNLAMRFF
jgi:hypothetical protein